MRGYVVIDLNACGCVLIDLNVWVCRDWIFVCVCVLILICVGVS